MSNGGVMPPVEDPLIDRARGSLVGLVLGHRWGSRSQGLSRRQVCDNPRSDSSEASPIRLVDGMKPPQGTGSTQDAGGQSFAAGAAVALHVARDVVAGWAGEDPDQFVAVGSAPVRIPNSTSAVLAAIPIGVASGCEPLEPLVRLVTRACRPVGSSRLECGAAAALAVAVSAGLAGSDLPEVAMLAMAAADLGGENGVDAPGPDLAARITWARALASRTESDPVAIIDLLVGTSPVLQETVPTVFALLARFDENPWQPCAVAAQLGGDGAMIGGATGAIAGACHGLSAFPPDVLGEVLTKAELDEVVGLADGLLGLRLRTALAVGAP